MIDPAARSGNPDLDQWFTAFWAAQELAEDALRGMGAVSVVEPACGTGAFLAAIPKACPAFGVDIDPAVIPAAEANSGREVLLGDFRTIDLSGRAVELVLGNPPFGLRTIQGFIARAHQLLPEGGRVAMILPGYTFQTPSVVTRWMDRFAIDVNVIPRTIFPGISKTLLWVKFTKTGERRFHGMMLFREQFDLQNMRPWVREALIRPGTWREAVRQALEALGGEASLAAIYDLILPERRRVSQHWRPQVRKILQMHFRPVERGRWAL